MGYIVEISFDMLKHNNVSEMKEQIIHFALEFECNHYYSIYEMDKISKFNRNHCIILVNFDDIEIFNCAQFIKKIKQINDLYIECIYEDTLLCKLIYASQYYLTNIDKEKVLLYNKFKRERSYSDNEEMILKVVSKKQRSNSV